MQLYAKCKLSVASFQKIFFQQKMVSCIKTQEMRLSSKCHILPLRVLEC